MSDLLPANSTAIERAISNAMDRAGSIPTPANLMWDPQRIPADLLPWLAWAVSVDDWNPQWSDAEKRAAIRGSADWHRIKGTRLSVMRVLAALGHADAGVIEDRALPRYGRGWAHGRAWRYGPTDPSWADYWIETTAPLDQACADMIAARLAETAPARCRLRSIRARRAHRRTYGDGGWTYGRAVTFGTVYIYGEKHG